MIKGLLAATDIKMPKLKIALIGDTGIGKSWLATSIAAEDHQVIDLDFDGRAASLAGKPNVFVKSYIDEDYENPRAISDLEADMSIWEYEAKEKKLPFKTFILDSATFFTRAIGREAIRQQKTAVGRKLITLPGNRNIWVTAGYDGWNINKEYVLNIFSRLSSLGNLIVTFVDRDERDNTAKDDKGNPILGYTGKVTVEPQHLAFALATFNDVWWLHGEYGVRQLTMGLSKDFNIGKNTLGLAPDQTDIDLKKLLAKSSLARNGKENPTK